MRSNTLQHQVRAAAFLIGAATCLAGCGGDSSTSSGSSGGFQSGGSSATSSINDFSAGPGTGNPSDFPFPVPNNTLTRELVIIANRGNNTLTVKDLNMSSGASSVLNSQFDVGVGTAPTIVKSHPNLNVCYVLNVGSATISQYFVNQNGGLTFLGPVATPPNPQYLAVHPSGAFVYVGSASGGTNLPGSIRRYTVAANGLLTTAGADVATSSNFTANTARVKDADFSFGGGVLHSPEVNKVESFNIASDGSLTTTGVGPTLTGATSEALDVDVRPGQTALVTAVRTGAGNDRLLSFPVNNGVVGAIATDLDSGSSTLGLGDFAANGQFYVGSSSAPQAFGFNVNASTGALTALATNPMAVAAGVSSFLALDPSNNFILTTSGAPDNILTARFRASSGEFMGSTSDTQSLSTPAGFDFFTFNF